MIDRAHFVVAAIVLLLAPSMALAQEQSKSSALVTQLVKLLDANKLDSIAAQVGSADQFAGALYFPGSQLLVVGARYSAPQAMELKLGQKKYRDIYIDLNSASISDSKILITDLGANGLFPRRENDRPFDTVDLMGKSYIFDGDWDRAKMSEDEYRKAFQTSDEEYTKILQALVSQLEKPS